MGTYFVNENFSFVSSVKLWEIYDEKRKSWKKYFSMGKKDSERVIGYAFRIGYLYRANYLP